MVEGVSPHIAARAARVAPRESRFDTVPMTGFYPLYDGDEDQVDRIARISSVAFQRVIPRYRLSSSATRDSGLGPAFYDVPVYRSGGRPLPSVDRPPPQETHPGHEAQEAQTSGGLSASIGTMDRGRIAPLYPWQGHYVDLIV